MNEPESLYHEREEMISAQIKRRGIHNLRLLDAFRRFPRHFFVTPEQRDKAYGDFPLPTGHGQTISQPFIVALMTDLLRLQGDEIVLEVGTGSGFQAAILSFLARRVHTIEYYPDLAERAQDMFAQLEITNVSVHVGDGSLGLPTYAPYQGILVTAAAPRPPQPLLEQLSLGGRLVLPVGGFPEQTLQVWLRQRSGFRTINAGPVAFVPLRGAYGWREDEWE